MRNERRARAVATAVLLLVALSACAGEGTDPAASTSPPPISSTSPSPTTSTSPSTPPSDSEVASTAASELVRSYYTVRDDLRKDPSSPLSQLRTVAVSTELKAQQTLFKREREQGLHQTGNTEIGELTVQSVNLDNSDPAAGAVPTVQVDICWNVRHVDILDRSGKSVVRRDRPNVGWIRYTVANYRWASDPTGSWRVASSQDLKKAPCAAS